MSDNVVDFADSADARRLRERHRVLSEQTVGSSADAYARRAEDALRLLPAARDATERQMVVAIIESWIALAEHRLADLQPA